RPRPAFDVPERPGTRYSVIADKEATATGVAISNLRPARPQDTVGGYRQIIMDQLFGDMLDARLDELDQRENPPFLRAAAGRRLFDTPRTKDEVLLQALVPNDGVARGLDALITEIQRIVRYGFTATELARAKQAMMASYERSVTESPDRESASRADEYTRNFLQREALPTIFQELAFHRRFAPGSTPAATNPLAAQWFPAVTPFIGDTDQGMTGGSTPQDLETFFQLLHLRFTQPRADPAAFFALSAQVRALVANRSASPDVVFRQEINETLTQKSPRRSPDT